MDHNGYFGRSAMDTTLEVVAQIPSRRRKCGPQWVLYFGRSAMDTLEVVAQIPSLNKEKMRTTMGILDATEWIPWK